jgi:hypothetical protein
MIYTLREFKLKKVILYEILITRISHEKFLGQILHKELLKSIIHQQ